MEAMLALIVMGFFMLLNTIDQIEDMRAIGVDRFQVGLMTISWLCWAALMIISIFEV